MIILIAVVVALLVYSLSKITFSGAEQLPWDISIQPKLHAILNSITALSIAFGVIAVKRKLITIHRLCMFVALLASALFLVSYVMYHALTESTSFGGEGFIKYVYYFILITHIILAAVVFPFVLMTVHRAITNQIEKHKTLAKYTFPIWFYVALTGVVVYVMIAPYY